MVELLLADERALRLCASRPNEASARAENGIGPTIQVVGEQITAAARHEDEPQAGISCALVEGNPNAVRKVKGALSNVRRGRRIHR